MLAVPPGSADVAMVQNGYSCPAQPPRGTEAEPGGSPGVGCDLTRASRVFLVGTTMDDQVDRAADEIRTFLAARPAPDVRAAVMGRIETLEPFAFTPRAALLRRVAAFLWTPREVSVRPAFALPAAAAVVVLLLGRYVAPTERPEVGRGAVPHVFVQFRLDAMASRVQLAGSFTNWEARYDLRQSVPGTWTITIPLTQGVHDYAFIVDGKQWVADPQAPQIGDGFGGTNSRLALLPPDMPQL